MSRATISTGSVTFDSQSDSRPPDSDDSCHIVILADFSGRDHRDLNSPETIRQRKIIEIDRDNFDDVFCQLGVQCDLPVADEPMVFAELDDMHPDFIYENVSLFEKFRQLKRKLKKPSTFAAAAEEIDQWGRSYKPAATESVAAEPGGSYPSGSLLDDILSGSTVSQAPGEFDVQALVKDIIAPYISSRPDPKQQDYIQSVDEATSNLMRKLMHHGQFQAIESVWRSLYLLVRRIETDDKLKLFVVDISQRELIDDALASETHEQTGIYKLLVESRQVAGASAFSVLMADMMFGQSQDELTSLSNLGKIAESINAACISGGSEQLAGCENLALAPDRNDWSFELPDDISEKWQRLRDTSQARHITLVAPRYLTRMPYGSKTSPIDSFPFEELPAHSRHPYYLWSTGAWLLTLAMAQTFSVSGRCFPLALQEIDSLPLHVYYEDDEARITPCAEINMLDTAASALREAGLLPIRSLVDKDSIMIPGLVSISSAES